MKAKRSLALAVICGTACTVQAQEYMRVSYQWSEVNVGTTTPSSNLNGELQPGESMRLQITLTLLRNGMSAIGQTTTYSPPPSPGVGTIAGTGSFLYNLYGLNDATGTWYGRSIIGIMGAGASTGTVGNNGALVSNLGGGQFVPPGGTANSTNPIVGGFVGYWTPNSYAARWGYWQLQPGSATLPGQHTTEIIKYGVDPSGFPQYTSKYIDVDFGLGIDINIGIPAPSGAAILGLGAAALSRRRRR